MKERVLKAARALGYPFVLGEVVTETRLPAYIVQRVLSRSVKQGILTRRPMLKTYRLTGGKARLNAPGGKVRRVWLYSFVEGR